VIGMPIRPGVDRRVREAIHSWMVCVSVLCAFTTADAQAQNLVANGGFEEDADQDGLPDGWRRYSGEGDEAYDPATGYGWRDEATGYARIIERDRWSGDTPGGSTWRCRLPRSEAQASGAGMAKHCSERQAARPTPGRPATQGNPGRDAGRCLLR